MPRRHYATGFPDGTRVMWRPLTWDEHRRLTAKFGPAPEGPAAWLLREAAAALCILDWEVPGSPDIAYDDLLAGVVDVVGTQILRETGFSPQASTIRQLKAAAEEALSSDWYESALSYVLAAFRVDERDVRNWTVDRFMTYVVRAEQVLGREIPVLTEADLEALQRREERRAGGAPKRPRR